MRSMDIEEFLEREELTKATVAKRAMAFFIDSILLAIIAVIIHFEAFEALSIHATVEAQLAFQSQVLTTYLPLAFIYQTLFVTLYGATVGKIVMKIRIIDLQTGATPQFGIALNRSTVRIISEIIFNLGFLWAFFTPHLQAWHDLSARTIVIDA